MKKTMIR